MSNITETIDDKAQRRLWMYAVTAINHGLWLEAECIFDALIVFPLMRNDVKTGAAFLKWRRDHCLLAVGVLEAQVRDRSGKMAPLFLAYVYLESGMLDKALHNLHLLMQSDDDEITKLAQYLDQHLAHALLVDAQTMQ